MGSTPGLFVDPAALHAAAQAFDSIAGSVTDIGRLRLGFGAAGAGRGHGSDGGLLRDGLDALSSDLRAWARSATEVADQLRFSAERYVDSERAVGAGLG